MYNVQWTNRVAEAKSKLQQLAKEHKQKTGEKRPHQTGGSSQDYSRESMVYTPMKSAIKTPSKPAIETPMKKTQPAEQPPASVAKWNKWKSSFQPAEEKSPPDVCSQDRSTSSEKPPATRFNDKVMIPQEEYPKINFVGLLIGPRGNTLKNIENECSANILIRGKGSAKEGNVVHKDGQILPGDFEPLHALVTANTMDNVKKAMEQIHNILDQAIEAPDDQNDLRKMQMRELARLKSTPRGDDRILNGPWQNTEPLCTKCGGTGHISSYCKFARAELYDPYDPESSESETEMPQGREGHRPDQENDLRHHPDQENDLRHRGYEHASPGGGHPDKSSHWDSAYSKPQRDFSPEMGPTECRGLSPSNRPERQAYSPPNTGKRRAYSPNTGKQQAYSPNTEPLERQGYSSFNRPLDHRGFSPDRLGPASSTRRMSPSELSTLPASYSEQRTNGEERRTIPEYRREMTTTVRLSPPRLPRWAMGTSQEDTSGYVGRGDGEQDMARSSSGSLEMEESPFTCELCEVEFSKMQELEDHLENKSHWDTLEHIKQQNNYDDLAVAFLQEVMLFKVRQGIRAVEDSAVEALRDNEHMSKVEMFHCAACKVYLSISAASVVKHLNSQEHLRSKKEFGMWQRRACLDKAETMMMLLKPQFEQFLKGQDPFE